MYNEFVQSYCERHGLEILEGVFQNFVVAGNRLIAEFKNHENVITFYNEDGSEKPVVRKGDLVMFMIEDQKAH
tara:strand:- start:1238 stop:1456 length:219 start_codon:yes stop_codon:yes gene_type:complete